MWLGGRHENEPESGGWDAGLRSLEQESACWGDTRSAGWYETESDRSCWVQQNHEEQQRWSG